MRMRCSEIVHHSTSNIRLSSWISESPFHHAKLAQAEEFAKQSPWHCHTLERRTPSMIEPEIRSEVE